jgi:hypothetical protein
MVLFVAEMQRKHNITAQQSALLCVDMENIFLCHDEERQLLIKIC